MFVFVQEYGGGVGGMCRQVFVDVVVVVVGMSTRELCLFRRLGAACRALNKSSNQTV